MIEPRPWNRQATTIGSFVPRYPDDAPARIERWCERCGARLRRGNHANRCDPCLLLQEDARLAILAAMPRCDWCGGIIHSRRAKRYCSLECRNNGNRRTPPNRIHYTHPQCACGAPCASFHRKRDGATGYRSMCATCRRTSVPDSCQTTRTYRDGLEDTAA